MNPIENLWDLLKQEVGKLPTATSREQLKTRIMQAWANLGERTEVLQSLCDSMPRRIQRLLEAKGGTTKYWIKQIIWICQSLILKHLFMKIIDEEKN